MFLHTLACWRGGAPLLAVGMTSDGGGSQQPEARVTLVENQRVAEQRVAGVNPGYGPAGRIWTAGSDRKPCRQNGQTNRMQCAATSSSSPASGSFHGLRSRGGTSGCEQGSMSCALSVREKGLAGTRVMWLLSQMMRDRETA